MTEDAHPRAAGRSMPAALKRPPRGPARPSSVPIVHRDSAEALPEGPAPDETRDLAANGGGGGGSGSGSGSGSGGPAPASSASLALSNDTYDDTGGESHKNIKYTATWSGGAKEDYIIVQWLKGYSKNADGTPRKVTMYGSDVDFDFADWQIDSVDADPAYWSNSAGRWNYNVDAPNKFSATDDPGPVKASQGVGREAKVDFKTAVYKASDVPTTTKGTVAATPLSAFQPWSYHVKVVAGGKFTH